MAKGTLGEQGEHDWLAATLTAGQAYEFTITGLSNFGFIQVGTSTALDEGVSTLQSDAPPADVVSPETQTVWFTPDADGTYYVDVSDPGTIGGYSVSAVAVPNDFPNQTTTTGVVTVGGAATDGTLGEQGEHDWLAATLTAGQAYEFTITGLSNFGFIQVGTSTALDEGVSTLQSDAPPADVVSPETQTVWFTPDADGTYYVDVSDPGTIGGYSVSAVAVPNDFPNQTTTTGVVTVGGAATDGTLGEQGEHDWLAATLTAGQAYEFTVTGLSNFGFIQVGTSTALDEGVSTLQSDAPPADTVSPETQTVWFTPDADGIYYVDVSDPGTIGGYSVSAVAVPNDFPNKITTTGVVTVGGAATGGTLGEQGEHDWLAATLTAGQAYEFTIAGLSNFGFVQVGTSTALDEGVSTLQSDAPPADTVSPETQTVWFTPDADGIYYVDVSDPGTIGGYSVSAAAVPNDFPNKTTTTGVVTVGGAATDGTLGEQGEHDWLAVTLTAGQAYEFTVTGLSNFGFVQVGTSTALDEGVSTLQSDAPPADTVSPETQTVWFTPDADGIYYVDVSDPGTIGGYSVSAVAVPNDFPNKITTTGVVTICFAEGTLIATVAGEVPVERLSVGDLVLTQRGEARPIVWLGNGRVLATRGQRSAATPVIVRRGAIADNVPRRDLRVTKGHSLYIDDVLIPVEFLVNHRSVLWDDRAQEVSIYHIELATHDVLIADGAPAESYRDDGNRWLFRNPNIGWQLPPQPPCAPIHTGGELIDKVWRRLLERAGHPRNIPLTEDPDLHLFVDGKRIDAIERRDDMHVFRLPARPQRVKIRSRASVPQELGVARDARSLGVAVRRISLAQSRRVRTIEANAASLTDGFHPFEPTGGIRWTNGDAAIPADLFAGTSGASMLILHLGGVSQYCDDGRIVRAA